MFRRFFGCVVLVAFIYLSQFTYASVVSVKVHQKGNITSHGSGVVIGSFNDESLIISAGHLFKNKSINSININGYSGKLIFAEYSSDNKDDIAILTIKEKLVPQWKTNLENIDDIVVISGYKFAELNLTNLHGGKILEMKETYGWIKGAVSIDGMSGGPILAVKNNKHICVGVVVGKSENTKESQFTPMSYINKKLEEHCKGWTNE